MSTFNGIVQEFPEIRIDYFRIHTDLKPPSACFLSHVHSDHLMGLESLKMPFVYCSAATKRILLRMEKYPHRINYAKGILEARKQHYRHLEKVLRTLPLLTPVELEISPKSTLRVTLFDANHCPGAVMFLIEGSGKAILYTGDVRAESWWVNSIVRNPLLLPYASAQKCLDSIYLDTTFASHDDIYKDFPAKSEGLKELLDKVSKCSSETVFYFRAWTLGYEDVWLALTGYLNSKVHVDLYQLRIFRSLVDGGNQAAIPEAPSLAGYVVGNSAHPGCLTLDTSARIHSCEPGSLCHAELLKNKKVVWITPIISRLKDGTEVLELGAGGGGGDLYQVPELEVNDEIGLHALQALCNDLVKDEQIRSKLIQGLVDAEQTGTKRMSLEGLGLDPEVEMTLKDFVEIVSKRGKWSTSDRRTSQVVEHTPNSRSKPDTIHFPYSRHSSYSELRHLVSVFRPKDICACTVDRENWCEDVSMESLFGDLCSANDFAHDQEVRSAAPKQNEIKQKPPIRKRKRSDAESQSTQASKEVSVEDVSDEQFKSAVSSLVTTNDLASKAGTHDIQASPTHQPNQPEKAPMQQQNGNRQNQSDYLLAIKREYEKLTANPDHASQADEMAVGVIGRRETIEDSQNSLSTSAFDSQTCEDSNVPPAIDASRLQRQLQGDGCNSLEDIFEKRSERMTARRDAYNAARALLRDDNHSQWSDLNLRSVKKDGHSHKETLL